MPRGTVPLEGVALGVGELEPTVTVAHGFYRVSDLYPDMRRDDRGVE